MDKKYQKILTYSVDEKITLGQIKEKNDFSFILSNPKNQSKIESLNKWIQEKWIFWILWDDVDYPTKFHSIKNSPYLIYAMWNLALLDKKILWIVWSRDMSRYWAQVLEWLFQNIQNSELVTVSWMARWVDYKCHQLSMQSNLPTIAILWWGIRYYWNSSAREFMQQIIEKWGLILSEFKLDFKPTMWSFPQRNRLISWLCDVLFLPEAREWSGSLITAEFAYQQKKQIFVAPNSIFAENWRWVNGLVNLKKATLLSKFSQILDSFEIEQKTMISSYDEKAKIILTDEEKTLIDIVSKNQNVDFSVWMYQISSDFWEALAKMTEMEMKWYVYQSEFWCYQVDSSIK